MTALDYILDGLEAELALERELGVRSVECARELLSPLEKPRFAAPTATASTSGSAHAPVPPRRDASVPREVRTPSAPPKSAAPAALSGRYDFAFLHDRPLSPGGTEMMSKIIAALGKMPETAPIICDGAIPRAKVLVVLGGNALKKWFPSVGGAPGQWIEKGSIRNVLVTYSPEFILRFGPVTPKVKAIKTSMWQSLKSVLVRVKSVE